MFAIFMLHAALLVMGVTPQVVCGIAAATPTALEEPALLDFNGRIDRYRDLHRAVERSLGLHRTFEDGEDMEDTMDALRAGIRSARAGAQPGEFLTPEVATIVRVRLARTIRACGYRVEAILAFLNAEREPGTRRPRINEAFPWSLGSSMWPTLLAALPPLPEELQYRFVDRELVLIDVDADLVIDTLPNALPDPALDGETAVGRR